MIFIDCLLKCFVYREGGKEDQFIKVNCHIQSRHGIMIIGSKKVIEHGLVLSKTTTEA